MTFKIYIDEDLSVNNHAYLFLLYEPLMGSRAAKLYELLILLKGLRESYELEEILELARINRTQFERIRSRLEEFNLLQTYADSNRENFSLHLYPCLNPQRFLSDTVFSRLTLSRLSQQYFLSVLDLFGLEQEQKEGIENISSRLDLEKIEQSWSWQDEDFFMKHRPEVKTLSDYDFDWDDFYKGMDRLMPNRLRSTGNMNEIARLADIYHADESTMRRYVIRCMNKNKTKIDFERLEKALHHITLKDQPDLKTTDPYMAHPIDFLKNYSASTPVTTFERKLLALLVDTYKFPYDVINIMIEHCLKNCDNQFNESYIRRVANTWSRQGIMDRKQALEACRQHDQAPRSFKGQKFQKKTLQLPEYFSEKSKKPTAELKAEVERLRKQLAGEDDA